MSKVFPILIEGHALGLGKPVEHGPAQLIRVSLAIGVERPAPFPRIDAHGEWTRVFDRSGDGGDLVMLLARYDLDAGGFDPLQGFGHRPLRSRRRRGPAGRLEESQAARLARCRRARRPKQARVSRVSASARGDLVSDLPGVFQCGGEYAAGALAQSIIATAAIERADARLEAHAAAIASGPNGRADYLGAERCAEHSRRHCRRRATTRSTRRASQVMRVTRTARLSSCEFRGHGLPNNDRAGFAQRRYARGVALGVPAREKRRAVLGRHIGGLDDVLDAEWHTVDGRAGPGLAPAFGGFVGGCTRPLKIEMHESTDLWFEYGEIGKAALEKIARCIGAIGKARCGIEVRLWHEFELFFRRQHDDALRCTGLQIRHLLPEPGFAPHLLRPTCINYGNQIRTELNPGIQNVFDGHRRIWTLIRQVNQHCLFRNSLQRNLIDRLSFIDHVPWRIDVSPIVY